MMHFVGNSTLELEGDEARTRTYLINPMAVAADGGIRHAFSVCAHYVDRLVRTREGWRIAERIEEQVIFEGAPPQKRQAALLIPIRFSRTGRRVDMGSCLGSGPHAAVSRRHA